MANNRVYRALGLVALFVFLGVLPFNLKFHQQDFMIFLLINVLVVVSYRLMTLTGEWSLIHVVVMGVGAYSSALLTKYLGLSFWLRRRFALPPAFPTLSVAKSAATIRGFDARFAGNQAHVLISVRAMVCDICFVCRTGLNPVRTG